jgi:hypothetical protein
MWAQVVAAATERVASFLAGGDDINLHAAPPNILPLMLSLLDEPALAQIVLERRSAGLCSAPGCLSERRSEDTTAAHSDLIVVLSVSTAGQRKNGHDRRQRELTSGFCPTDEALWGTDEAEEFLDAAVMEPVRVTTSDMCCQKCEAFFMSSVLPAARQTSVVWSRPGIVSTIGKLFPNLSAGSLHNILAAGEARLAATLPGMHVVSEREVAFPLAPDEKQAAATAADERFRSLLQQVHFSPFSFDSDFGDDIGGGSGRRSLHRSHLGCCEQVLDFVSTNVTPSTQQFFCGRFRELQQKKPLRASLEGDGKNGYSILVSPLVARIFDYQSDLAAADSSAPPCLDKITTAQRLFSCMEKLHSQAPRLAHLLRFDEEQVLRVITLVQHHLSPTLVFPFCVALDDDAWLLLLLVFLVGFAAIDQAVENEWWLVAGEEAVEVVEAVGANVRFVIDLAAALFL